MALVTNAFPTYSAIGVREDLTDMITNISPSDTLFYNMIGSTNVTQTKHEWQTDSLAATDTANQQLEGDTIAAVAITATTRLANYAQIQYKSFAITGTEEVVKKAGRQSEIDYQTAKRMKELAKDIEYDFLHGGVSANNGYVVGDTTTARKLKGYDHFCVTNNGLGAGGVQNATHGGITTGGTDRDLTEAILAAVLQNCFTSGGSPTTVLAPPAQKRKISGFAGSGNYRTFVENKKLETAVDVYVGDFGSVKILPHRVMKAGQIHIVDSAYWKKGILRGTHKTELAKTGDAQHFAIIVEHTLESSAAGNDSAVIFDLNS